VQVCPSCGEENPDRFRICGICGTKLAPEDVAQEVRKTVTVVFSDLKGSTNLGEKLDTESLREVLNVYFNEMRAVLERHGGTVEKYIGDAIMAVFGLPKLHEDDALRAVRAAHEMQRTLERVNLRLEETWGVRLENRTGVNTGEVVAGDVSAGQRLVTGDTVNTAARLEQAAPALEILVGEPTYRLVKDAVTVEPVEPLELKGKAERVPAYRLVSVAERDEGVARRLDAPMVGRADELQVLMDSLDRAESERRAQLVTVFGPAGVGKSRLLREFLGRGGERVSALRGRCLSYGDGITFWPLAEALRGGAGIGDDDPLEMAQAKLLALAGESEREAVERVAAAIGLSDASYPIQETFWGAREVLECLASTRPLVLLIDDIHWAEEAFLDLLRFLVDSAEAPLILVCSSRPELLEDHAEWVHESHNVKRIVLEPLTDAESGQVVENLLGSSLDEQVRTKIIEAADGNPLFVEQMLSMLIDDAILKREDDGRWVVIGDLGAITIPPSISALLTARLDRLGASERTVVERGAVMGQVFFRGAAEELSPEGVRPNVGPSLQSLIRKELIRPDESTFAGQEAYRFLHILIREAAYSGLLKRTRAELHERFVDWLERVASDRVMEFEEIRGYHLEQAHLILLELAPADEHVIQIGRRGAAYLASAGERALARGDLHAAANLLQRAARVLPADDGRRPWLLVEAGEALIEMGEFSQADEVLGASIEEAGAIGDRGTESTAALARIELHYLSEGAEKNERIVEEVERHISVLESVGHHQGLARANKLLTQVHWTARRLGPAEQTTERLIEHARLAGDSLMEIRALPSLAICAADGPMPVPQAIERCEEILGKVATDRKAAAITGLILAHLEAMRGNFERARELYPRSRAVLQELGWTFDAALTSMDSGRVELLAGDPVAAEAELRRDYEALHRMGEKNYVSTNAAVLAEAVYRQGRYDDAETLTVESESVSAPDDDETQSLWRCVRGKTYARAGRFEEAEALAREGFALLRESDAIVLKGHALLDLAEVLELAGKLDEAQTALREALALFEAKGNVVSAARARERMSELAATSRA
jgi:predicted ATPase/class 3 adenylate cyclase